MMATSIFWLHYICPRQSTLSIITSSFADCSTMLDFLVHSSIGFHNRRPTANFELRRISFIRRLLTTETTATIVSDFILSRLHCCTSLLSGCPRSSKKISFYIAQCPDRWTAQSALHCLSSLADLFIPTPTRLLREHSSHAAITRSD